METFIVGASGSSAELALILDSPNSNTGGHLAVGFLDDNPKLHNKIILDLAVIGGTNLLKNYPDNGFISGIGNNNNFLNRLQILQNLNKMSHSVICISKLSLISKSAIIESGVIISFNCFVGSNSKIGEFVYIMPNSTIGHDTLIGKGTIICSGVTISGDVNIGESCYIGAGATIQDHISIAPGTLIGSGSNVISNIDYGGTYVGNPARKLATNA